jgi:prepilin-type N-terminal cleavage/methylation domain-containing protein
MDLMRRGFTLIELSVVLVVIGLIVGGILVGQNLINAAALRAQITQIEKFQTATNTFREKYGYLPGDMPAQPAAQFGLGARGAYPGEGDGNGIIEGNQYNTATPANGMVLCTGETIMFWVDLSAAHLIEGSYQGSESAACNTSMSLTSSPALGAYFPQAAIGNSNYVYVYSGGSLISSVWNSWGINYFAISAITGMRSNYMLNSVPALTVAQASAIDTKTDDGFPVTGNVTVWYLNGTNSVQYAVLATGGGGSSNTSLTQTYGSSATCFDNGNVSGATEHYSLEQHNGK